MYVLTVQYAVWNVHNDVVHPLDFHGVIYVD